jgi:non-heme chloroperoxidase
MLTSALSVLVSGALVQAPTCVDASPHRATMIAVADDVQLEVLEFGGDGRSIVLLAGLGNTAHVFDEIAPKLTSLGRVYAITRRGYGLSSRPDSGYDVTQLGEDVRKVLDAFGLEKSVFVGHSKAGQELSYMANEHPGRIAGLVYLDAAYRYAYDVPGQFEKDFPSLPPPPATPPQVTRPPFVLPAGERCQPRGLPGATASMMAAPARQFMSLAVPVLAIFASPHDIGAAPDPVFDRFDEAQTERQARALERGVPTARVIRWARASHYLFLTQERAVLDELTKFLNALSDVRTHK